MTATHVPFASASFDSLSNLLITPRYLCKYILESCLPLPFPMYADRDDYLQALKVGDEACQDPGGARGAYAPLLLVTIEAAIQYYEELLQLSSKPLLIGRTPEEIEHAIKEQRVTCTPEDKETIKRAFDALPAFATGLSSCRRAACRSPKSCRSSLASQSLKR